MLDNLILAYRAQIYDWNISKWIDFCKKNKVLVFFIGMFILILGISVSVSIKSKSSLLMLLVLLSEGIVAIFIDRYTVKRYRKFLLNRQGHLDQTVIFLKTVISEKNLFTLENIEVLIERITKRIESKIPFKNFLTRLTNFSKAIILPVITYIAGIYSGNLGQIDFVTVTNWAMSIILILGIVNLTWNGIFIMLRMMICRDYDASIALLEDLMDIKLLHFSG